LALDTAASSRDARIAGALYVTWAIMAVVRAIYVPLTLFGGGAAATAARILEHEATFRLAMLTDLATAVLTLFLVLSLYRLLEPVNRACAVLMVILGLIITPLHFVNVLNDFAALLLVRGASALSAIPQVEREALAAFFLRVHEQGVAINRIFWALWLLVFAALVYRSRFLPRFLGVLLAINGVSYIVSSVSFFMLPTQSAARIANAILPAAAGEVVVMLWLLIRGRRTDKAGSVHSTPPPFAGPSVTDQAAAVPRTGRAG
jgi:hypothetical protein